MSRAERERREAADLDEENYLGHLSKLRESLDKETDRACVIIGAAFLDEALEALLRARLVDDASASSKEKRLEQLFEKNQLLSSFGAKIQIAFATGAISTNEREDADEIRDLRNDFAHLHTARSFDDPHVRAACKKLKILGGVEPSFIEARTRDCFIVGVGCIATAWWVRLAYHSERIQQMEHTTWTAELVADLAKDASGARDRSA